MDLPLSHKFLTAEFVTKQRLAGKTFREIGEMFDPVITPGALHQYDQSFKLVHERNKKLKKVELPENDYNGTKRKCLCCLRPFYSKEPKSVNRICSSCKQNNAGKVDL